MSGKNRKGETFADRFLELKGADSYQSLSDRLAKSGIQLSATALHKYSAGGEISRDNLMQLADFFDVSPAWLYLGIEERPTDALPADLEMLVKALEVIPDRFRREIDRDILKIALAYTDKERDRTLYDKLARALQQLDKR